MPASTPSDTVFVDPISRHKDQIFILGVVHDIHIPGVLTSHWLVIPVTSCWATIAIVPKMQDVAKGMQCRPRKVGSSPNINDVEWMIGMHIDAALAAKYVPAKTFQTSME
jgi:hypothetical protein